MPIDLKKYPDASTLRELQDAFPTAPPLSLGLWMKMVRFMGELMRSLESHYAQWDISRGRFLILVVLADAHRANEGGVIPSVLADKLDVSRGNMTGLIDALLKSGLIHKKKDEKDRRVVYLTISESGLALIEGILPVHTAIVSRFMDILNDQQKSAMIEGLDQLQPSLRTFRSKN